MKSRQKLRMGGDGTGVARLVHQSRFGDWDHDEGFGENTGPLTRVCGRIARINGPQAGLVELSGRLEACFVPAKSVFPVGSGNTHLYPFSWASATTGPVRGM